MSASSSSSRAVALALAANGGIAVAKFGVFLLTGSSSLLTEAIHSTADCANQVLLFIGLRQGQKTPGPRHPLGYGQAPFVASFLVALLLFSMGGLYSLVEGIHKIRHPEQPHLLGWAIALLIFAVGLLMVALKVRFKDQPSGAALVDAINALERHLREQFPQIQHLFVEPDES